MSRQKKNEMTFVERILSRIRKNKICDSNSEESDSADKDDLELLELHSKIDKAKQLSKIMSTTLDKDEFLISLAELKEILKELVKYEERYEIDPAPSKDLEYLEKVEKEQFEFLEKRIADKEKETGSKRRIENTTDKFGPDEQTKVPYDDRFDEEYRKVNTYREISFSGKEWNSPEVQLCATLLLYQSRKGAEIGKNVTYSRYYEGKYGITNISKLHKWLYEKEYLRDATLFESLGLYKVSELKTILESLGLKKTGNKDDLIKRIVESISDKEKAKIIKGCSYLFLTEKGKAFLDENYDFVLYHRSQYEISLEEFCKNRFVGNKKRTFNYTVYQILTARAYTYQLLKYFSRLEMVYWNLSNICDSEGNGELALRYALYRLYFSTNLASHPELFNVELLKFNGVENFKNRINSAVVFNNYILNRVVELKPHFREHMLDVIYTPEILPYCLFGKYDMLDAILDLYDGKFDAEFYTNYIRINYANYIRHFLQ